MKIRDKGEANLKYMTLKETFKFYCTILLSIMASIASSAFILLIPFVVQPSVSTILADFSSVPVVCSLARHDYAEGISNCTWTSCKEGCTSITPRCHQLYVNYSKMPYADWDPEKSSVERMEWAESYVKFFINIDGCGYPPRVNCTQFLLTYGENEDDSPSIFPCFYSRTYPQDRVVANYDKLNTIKNLLLAIGIPAVVFTISAVILGYWNCASTTSDKKNIILDPTCIFATNIIGDGRYHQDVEEEDTDDDYVEKEVDNNRKKYVKFDNNLIG